MILPKVRYIWDCGKKHDKKSFLLYFLSCPSDSGIPALSLWCTIFLPQLLLRSYLSSTPSLNSSRTPLWFQQPCGGWFLGNLYYDLLSLLTFDISNVPTFSISGLLILLFSSITGKTDVHKQWKGKNYNGLNSNWCVQVSGLKRTDTV